MHRFMVMLCAIGLLVCGYADAATLTVGPGQTYTTIQSAVTAASPDDTIVVLAGTYTGSVTVNKPLTLLGANAGIHPATGTDDSEVLGVRAAETILSNNYPAIVPAADNITIDGFYFSGSGGRIIDTYADANNFHLTNCIFANNTAGTTQGVLQFGGGSHLNMLLDFNLFQDQGDHTLYFGGGPYDGLTVSGNKFNGAGDSFFWSATAMVDAIIQNNEFDGTIGGVPGVGFNTINIGQAGNLQLNGNWFHDCLYNPVQVGIIGGSITGNLFERIYEYPTYGGDCLQLWGGQWGTAVSTDVDISGNIFRYNDVAGSGSPVHALRLRAPESGSGIDATTIHFNNNCVLDGGVRSDAYAVRHQGDALTELDAENNWWGTAVESEIAAMMNGPVDYDPWLGANPSCNILQLAVQGDPVYLQPGDSLVIDMDVLSLSQFILGCQAVLNFDSTYFLAGSGDVDVQSGGGIWDELIWNVWDSAGDLDVAVGVDLQSAIGTRDDGTIAKFTLNVDPSAPDGITQMIFRPDVDDVEGTFFADLNAQAVYPGLKIDSEDIIIDGSDPLIDITSAAQGSELLGGGVNAVQGDVTILVDASDALAGLAAIPTVTVTPNGQTAIDITSTGVALGGGIYSYTFTVTSATANGSAAIDASVSDNAGNSAGDSDVFDINKNAITVSIEQDSSSSATYSFDRDVLFVATDALSLAIKSWTVTVAFTNDGGALMLSGSCVLDDVPADTYGLSADTDWTLRSKITALDMSANSGQAVCDFVGAKALRPGDLNNSNTTNILDFALLKNHWFTTDPLADLNGDGSVRLEDFILLKRYWFQAGDPE